jgi:hypothetical protein
MFKKGDLVTVIFNEPSWNIDNANLPKDTYDLEAVSHKYVDKIAIVIETYLAFDREYGMNVNVYKIFMQETLHYIMALENEIEICNNLNQDVSNA